MGRDRTSTGRRTIGGQILAPLKARVIGDQGPSAGKVISMDEHRLQVLSHHRMVPGALHRMRIELRESGAQLDVELLVERVQSGLETMYKWGWVHHAVYREMDADDSQILDNELGTPTVGTSQNASSKPEATNSEPISTDTSGMARRSGRARVVRVMNRSTRRTRDDSISLTRRNPKVGDRREALLKKARPAPLLRKGVPESLLVRPLYVPGPPAGILAVFPSYQAVAKALEFDDAGVCVVLGGCESLEVGDVVGLVMELPDKTQLQLMTMVLRKGDERDYLKANFVSEEVMALLRSLA